MFKIIFVSMLFLFSSCFKGALLTTPAYIQNPSPVDTSKLSFEGFYSISNDKYANNLMAILPIIFKKNNKIYIAPGNFTKNRPMRCSDFASIKSSDLGTFIITGNEVKAFVPTSIAFGDGAYYKTYNLNYKGFIKYRDTIIDWHAVPPYPKSFDKAVFSSSHNTVTFEPQTYIFIKNEIVNCLKVE